MISCIAWESSRFLLWMVGFNHHDMIIDLLDELNNANQVSMIYLRVHHNEYIFL